MKTPTCFSLSLILGLALPLAGQTPGTTTSTTITTTKVATPGPTPTVVTEPAKVQATTPITDPNDAAAKVPGKRTMFQVVDTNGDGAISRLEFETYGATHSRSAQGGAVSAAAGSGSNGNAIGSTTNFGLLDVNSDGYLTAEEFARSSYHESAELPAVDTARETSASQPATSVIVTQPAALVPQPSSASALVFQAVDTNADGVITLQEFERYHTSVNPREGIENVTPKNFADSFQALDSDSDGKLSLREFSRANAKGDLDTTIRVNGN